MIKELWKWVTSHIRLVIEYVLIGLVVTLAGLALNSQLRIRSLNNTITGLNTSLGAMGVTLERQVEVNKAQDVAISDLRAAREADDNHILALEGKVTESYRNYVETKRRIAELEKTDEKTKTFLDLAIPDRVRCVLDGFPCEGGDGDEGRPADSE